MDLVISISCYNETILQLSSIIISMTAELEHLDFILRERGLC